MNRKTKINIVIWVCIILLVLFVGPLISIDEYRPLGPFVIRLLFLLLVGVIWYFLSLFFTLKVKIVDLSEQDGKTLTQLKKHLNETIEYITRGAKFLKGTHLYKRPWYLVIGSKSSGKTTLVEQSGLNFAWQRTSSTKHNSQMVDDCNWYVSDDAVFLDVSGRILAQAGEEEETSWSRFLRVLAFARPVAPINGIVLTINADELLLSDEHQLEIKINELREMMESISKIGITNIPVYVVISMMDKIPGFKEFFTSYSAADREQIWGITFPHKVPVPHKDSIELFSTYHQELLDRLNNCLFSSIRQANDATKNQNAFQFPRFFAFLESKIEKLLQGAIAQSSYYDKVKVRGVYFAAAEVQEHQVIKQTSHPYFVSNIFNQVILREASMGSIGERFINLSNQFKQFTLAGIILLVIILVIAWITGFTSSTTYISQINQDMLAYDTANKNSENITTVGINVRALMILRDSAYLQETEYDDWWVHLGFSFPDKLDTKVSGFYHQQLMATFLPFVLKSMQGQVSNFVNKDWSSYNQYDALVMKSELYRWLSSYLMFNQLKYLNREQIEQIMSKYWQDTYTGNTKTANALSMLLSDLLDLKLKPADVDTQLIGQARSTLGDDSAIIRSYVTLKTSASLKAFPPLMIGGKAADRAFKDPISLPYLYTQDGWSNFIKSNISSSIKQAAAQQWVFGNETGGFNEANIGTITTGVKSLYWHDYDQIWQQNYANLKLKSFDSIQSAVSITKLLSAPNSPLLVAASQVSDNFDNDNANGYSSYIAQIKVFANNTQLTQKLLQEINNLHELLLVIQTSENEGEQSYLFARTIATGKPNPLTDIMKIADDSPEPIKGWLTTLTHDTTLAVFNLAQTYITELWKQQIQPSCQLNFSDVAPFVENSSNDISSKRFAAFFGNDKLVMRFIKNYALPFVYEDKKTGQAVFISRFGVTFKLPEKLAETLITAYEINGLFFNGDDNLPSLSVTLTPQYLSQNLSQINIHYNDNNILYNNGPIYATKVNWPEKDNNVTVTYTYVNGDHYTNSYYGLWGFIKLLQTSELISSKDVSEFQIAFKHDNRKAVFNIQVNGNGYFPALFSLHSFNCNPGD